jgi:crotonobetainyl-CoA:carnitine CoA-transferase CaiB-like acyl-CoA transferase
MVEGMPLSDVQVIDAGQVIAGPVCGAYLADLGAEVVKLESPTGDILRGGAQTIDGEEVSTSYELVNRNKRSVSIDLKSDEGQEAVHSLIEKADVFLQNWPPGVAERLDVDYETLQELNEDLIYVHVTGYGETGPMADRPAMDTAIQHISGLSSLMGYEDHPPIRAQTSLGDYYAGTNAAVATLGALRHRDRGNGGQKVEISMLEALMHNLDSAFELYNNVEDFEFQKGRRNSYKFPDRLYGAAETEDGWVCVAFYLNSPGVWKGFCELVGREDLLEDPKYDDASNRLADAGKFSEMLEDWMRERTSEECLETLQEKGIPVAPHNSVPEAAEMEHVEERDVFQEVDHPRYGSITLTRPPFRLSETDPEIRRAAPLLGEYTAEALRKVGYSQEEIETLKDRSIVKD